MHTPTDGHVQQTLYTCNTPTNGHVQQAPRADDGEEAVDVVKDVAEHLGLGGGRGLRVRIMVMVSYGMIRELLISRDVVEHLGLDGGHGLQVWGGGEEVRRSQSPPTPSQHPCSRSQCPPSPGTWDQLSIDLGPQSRFVLPKPWDLGALGTWDPS